MNTEELITMVRQRKRLGRTCETLPMNTDELITKWKDAAVINLFNCYALGAMHEPEAAEARLLTGLEKTSEAEKAIRRVAEIYLR